jgi:hypothetical protein
MTDQPLTALGRRQLLGISISAAGVVAIQACANPQPKAGQSGAPAEEEVSVTPPEDLMREHGVLKRVLLIYREGIRRLQAGDEAPVQALNAGAGLFEILIEDYHEHLEEQYVFQSWSRRTNWPTPPLFAHATPAWTHAHRSGARRHYCSSGSR